MNKKEASIATITWARNEAEENLLRASMQQLAALEIPVFITDGGSKPAFLDFIRRFPHFSLVFASTKGLWAQAKSSLLAAYRTGAPFIFYTEPDKYDFFCQGLPQMLAEITTDAQSGIILASRSVIGFTTFPSFQQMTETTINNCCAEVIGQQLDYTYGPFLLNSQLIPYLNQLQEEIGWGWRPYAFVMAHRLGYGLASFRGDFSCPPDQRSDNQKERLYRMRQLSQNIEGIVMATQVVIER
ncbi:MAG: hypothetical protein ICV51_20475 [Flavisolibacter sp.]|nr:hypothetical protein [Flavisolibacter sp.]